MADFETWLLFGTIGFLVLVGWWIGFLLRDGAPAHHRTDEHFEIRLMVDPAVETERTGLKSLVRTTLRLARGAGSRLDRTSVSISDASHGRHVLLDGAPLGDVTGDTAGQQSSTAATSFAVLLLEPVSAETARLRLLSPDRSTPIFTVRTTTPAIDSVELSLASRMDRRRSTEKIALLLSAHLQAARVGHGPERSAPGQWSDPKSALSDSPAELSPGDRHSDPETAYLSAWQLFARTIDVPPRADTDQDLRTALTAFEAIARQVADRRWSDTDRARLALNLAVASRRLAHGRKTYLMLLQALDVTESAQTMMSQSDADTALTRQIRIAIAEERHRLLVRLAEIEQDPDRRQAALIAGSLTSNTDDLSEQQNAGADADQPTKRRAQLRIVSSDR